MHIIYKRHLGERDAINEAVMSHTEAHVRRLYPHKLGRSEFVCI